MKTRNWIVGLFFLGFIVGVNAQDDSTTASVPVYQTYAQTPTATAPSYQTYGQTPTATVPGYQTYGQTPTTTVPGYQTYGQTPTATVSSYQTYGQTPAATAPSYQPEESPTTEPTIPHLHTITPNAYGLGVNSDEFGTPQTYRTQDGQQLSPIFQGGVKQDAYGLGVSADQFGRPVYSSPP